MDSTQQVTVVTGTSRGLGKGIAEHFLLRGDTVIGCSRGETAGWEKERYHHYCVDATDETQVRDWARAVKRNFGKVDLLINNVGLVKLGAITGATSLDLFKQFVDAILISTFLVCREFSKLMVLQRQGRIVNFTSIMSELHEPGTCAYASAKKAVVEFSKVLAKELAPHGVTCNVVSPSLVNTEASSVFGLEWRENMLQLQTLPTAVEPVDLCHAIEFFASPRAWCVTGQVIHTCLVD